MTLQLVNLLRDIISYNLKLSQGTAACALAHTRLTRICVRDNFGARAGQKRKGTGRAHACYGRVTRLAKHVSFSFVCTSEHGQNNFVPRGRLPNNDFWTIDLIQIV